jgi:hypothetical protein
MTQTVTAAQIEIPAQHTAPKIEPEFLRLPKPGQLCPYTGLTRSFLNELILPTPRNNGKPPVRSFCLRQKGAKTGVRLIDFADLKRHIRQHPQETEAA